MVTRPDPTGSLPGPPFGGAQSQPRCTQSPQQLATRSQQRAGAHQVVEVFLGNVVVVPLKPAARDPCLLGEGMQFVVAHIADEMRPPTPLEPPDGGVDQHCHGRHCAVTSSR